MWLRGAVLGALSVALLAGPAGACPLPAVYPGDNAPKEAIAQWMARRATDRAIPAELPVMGALVASGVNNLNYGDADEVGYFQMRVGIWNQGAYAGFPDHPELQINWFLDQAIVNRQSRIAAGRPDPAGDVYLWGDWIADVLRPAEQFRGRYQPRLGEARDLIGPACPGDAPPAVPLPPSGSAPVATTPDTTAPVARLSGARDQHALRRGAVLVAVTCPAEACTASAAGTVRLPGRAHALRLRAKPVALAQGQTLTLRLALSRAARATVRRTLRTHRTLAAKLRITVADTIGNEATSSRTVRLTL
jgi:hypothetical protein